MYVYVTEKAIVTQVNEIPYSAFLWLLNGVLFIYVVLPFLHGFGWQELDTKKRKIKNFFRKKKTAFKRSDLKNALRHIACFRLNNITVRHTEVEQGAYQVFL